MLKNYMAKSKEKLVKITLILVTMLRRCLVIKNIFNALSLLLKGLLTCLLLIMGLVRIVLLCIKF